jgi:LmbE family N-acetylglucosaminyl deacetylase
MAARHNLTLKAAETMGLSLSHIHCLQYPDGGVAIEHPETERLAALLHELKPDAIFVPHHGEGWSDHLKAAEIVKALIGMFNENENTKHYTLNSKQEQRDLSKQERSASLNSKPEIYEYCVWMWYYNVWDLRMKDAFLLRLTGKQHQLKQLLHGVNQL